MNIDKYSIVVMDEFNLKLSVKVPKGRNPNTGKTAEGESDKFIGYYGTLSGALKKILSEELNSQVDTIALEDVLSALSALETRLDYRFGNRAQLKELKGEIL